MTFLPVAAAVAGPFWAEVIESRMDLMAFCARTGNQQLPDMLDTPIDVLVDFSRALQRLLKREEDAARGK